MRPLTAALAFSGGRYRVDGVPRMRERPIGDLVDALRPLGAEIALRVGNDGFPPLLIGPGRPRGGAACAIRGDVSSQFLTGAAAWRCRCCAPDVDASRSRATLISRPYVEITLNLMRRFGVAVERDGWRVVPRAGRRRLREPGHARRRRRRVRRIVFPRGRRDRRRAGARDRRGPRFDPGRRRLRGRARAPRRRRALRPGLDRGARRHAARRAARSTASRFPMPR